MESISRRRILDTIGKVYEKAKNCKLEDSFFESIHEELSLLAQYFHTSKPNAFFVSIVFTLNYKGDAVDINDLVDYFDCNPVKLLACHHDFESLCAKGIVEKQQSRHQMKLAGANEQFTIHEKIAEAILQNAPMPEVRQTNMEDIFSLLEKFYQLGEQQDLNQITTHELFHHSRVLIKTHTRFPLIKKMDALDFNIEDTYLYLYLVWKTLSGKESVDIGRALDGMFDRSSEKLHYMQKVISGNVVCGK